MIKSIIIVIFILSSSISHRFEWGSNIFRYIFLFFATRVSIGLIFEIYFFHFFPPLVCASMDFEVLLALYPISVLLALYGKVLFRCRCIELERTCHSKPVAIRATLHRFLFLHKHLQRSFMRALEKTTTQMILKIGDI